MATTSPHPPSPDPRHGVALPVVDLRARLALGRVRGAGLITEDEAALVERLDALPPPSALLVARLSARRPEAFRAPDLSAAGVDDVPAEVDALLEAGWLTEQVPWGLRAQEATREVLVEGCDRLGLRRSGRRETLQARLMDHEDWDDARWVRLTEGAAILRLERWGTLQTWPDRSRPVLERMGRVAWVDHPLTDGGGLLPSRAHWDRWEALVADWASLTAERALQALAWTHWPPGRLDLRRRLRRAVTDHARALERRGDLDDARALYESLREVVDAPEPAAALAVRHARVTERLGEAEAALSLLTEAREAAVGAGRRAVARAGRRTARAVGRAWPPDPPVRRPTVRDLDLIRVDDDRARPRWMGGAGEEPAVVEEAVRRHLQRAGRRVLHAEGGLWRTVLGLWLADAMFAPVPGQLPVPRLAAPVDFGTPAFAARRPGRLWDLWDALGRGEAGERARIAWRAHEGCRIAGVDWERPGEEPLFALLDGLSPAVARAILRAFCVQGRRATRGLPDLVVLPGPRVRVPGLFPGRLPEGVVFVEVKGPGDTLRDAQEVWLDRLSSAGASVEVWRVSDQGSPRRAAAAR